MRLEKTAGRTHTHTSKSLGTNGVGPRRDGGPEVDPRRAAHLWPKLVRRSCRRHWQSGGKAETVVNLRGLQLLAALRGRQRIAGTLEHGYLKAAPLPKVPLMGQSTLVC